MWAFRMRSRIRISQLNDHVLYIADNLACRSRQPHTAECRLFSGKSLPRIETSDSPKQQLSTLAIETSCDDTSVAVLAISRANGDQTLRTEVLFHEKVTANSEGYGGIHPLVALDSHQTHLGRLVQRAIQHLRPLSQYPSNGIAQPHPDFVSVTRGPGMRSNLAVGLDTAKGLALAWTVPLVGVHHMQAHALTSRLCATLGLDTDPDEPRDRYDDVAKTYVVDWDRTNLEPRFPFLSLLISGGHTMLIDSQSLVDHRILAETQDIAIGDYLDKVARAILPASELKAPFGKALELFALPTNGQYDYTAPRRRQDELKRRETTFDWSLSPPLAESKSGQKSSRRMVYSYAGLLSSVQRIVHGRAQNSGYASSDLAPTTNSKPDSERRELAREAQRVAFEHLGSRILLHLESDTHLTSSSPHVQTIVVSGGVASNKFLRHVLRSMLDARGYSNIELQFPPPELCTDNALMIAWAGMEMFDAGYESELSIEPLRKWSMDPGAEDGGILGVGGWKRNGQR